MSDSGSDSDSDFFISKRKPTLKTNTPPPVIASPGPSDGDDDSDPGRKKKRKKSYSKAGIVVLPDWARGGSEVRKERKRTAGRGSTEDRRVRASSSMTAVEDTGPKKKERERVVLTPPPPIPERKAQELRDLVQQMYGGTVEDDEEDDEVEPSSPLETLGDDDIVDVVVTMQVDPVKRAIAPKAILTVWDKPRTIKIGRKDTIYRVLETLGDRLSKVPEDIILVYEDNRVYPRETPRELGILGGSTMETTGYEKSYWDKLEVQRRARVDNFDVDRSPSPPGGQGGQPASGPHQVPATSSLRPGLPLGGGSAQSQPSAGSSVPPGEEASSEANVRITVRGRDGKEAKMKVAKSVTANVVLKFYCKQVERPKEDAAMLELVFDGDGVDRKTTVGDLDCEDGDMLEVREL